MVIQRKQIRSEKHFLVKRRIFNRLMNRCYDGDDQACVDAWNLSDEMLKFLDTIEDKFIRENAKCGLIERRRLILSVVSDDVLFDLKVFS